MHGDCLLMLGSVAMERNTQPSISTGASVCLFVWNKVMQKGRDASSLVLIGFALQNSIAHWLAFAHCFVNGWPAVTWQFVDPIISMFVCASMWMYVCAFALLFHPRILGNIILLILGSVQLNVMFVLMFMPTLGTSLCSLSVGPN